MSNASNDMGPGEAEMLAELRSVIDEVDAPPADVVAAAKASFTWRTVDADLAELAEITFDSLVDEEAGTLVRGAGPPRHTGRAGQPAQRGPYRRAGRPGARRGHGPYQPGRHARCPRPIRGRAARAGPGRFRVVGQRPRPRRGTTSQPATGHGGARRR